MPELPEVETVRRGLAEAMEGRRINQVLVRRTDLRRPLPGNFAEALEGQTITRLSRRAKYLLICLENETVVLAHLGMSGRMVIEQGTDAETPARKHEHIVFVVGNGTVIRFSDPRRFGLMDLTTESSLASHPLLANIGPEPLDDMFNGPALVQRLKGRKTPLKSALLDQRVVAGLGNIYVCEGLFLAGLSPRRSAHTVGLGRANKLVAATKKVLQEAIESGGSTLRDHVTATGEMGYFQHNFKVYGREGEACPVCNNEIRRIVQAGRSTFFCASCQG